MIHYSYKNKYQSHTGNSELIRDRERLSKSRCVVCDEVFREGDLLQAFLRSPDDPEGSWTNLVEVDAEFQQRHIRNGSIGIRKHGDCNER